MESLKCNKDVPLQVLEDFWNIADFHSGITKITTENEVVHLYYYKIL